MFDICRIFCWPSLLVIMFAAISKPKTIELIDAEMAFLIVMVAVVVGVGGMVETSQQNGCIFRQAPVQQHPLTSITPLSQYCTSLNILYRCVSMLHTMHSHITFQKMKTKIIWFCSDLKKTSCLDNNFYRLMFFTVL